MVPLHDVKDGVLCAMSVKNLSSFFPDHEITVISYTYSDATFWAHHSEFSVFYTEQYFWQNNKLGSMASTIARSEPVLFVLWNMF